MLVCEQCDEQFKPRPRGPRPPRFCSPRCQHKQWGRDNRERLRAIWRASYHRNPEPKKQRARKYALLHPDAARRAHKKFVQTDRGRAANVKNVLAHRARRLGAEGSHTTEEFLQIVGHFENKCLCCGERFERLTEDHVVPLSRGGSDWISNIQPLCHKCNSGKRDKTIDYRPKDSGYHPIPGQSVITSVSGGAAPESGLRAVP